MRFDERLLSVPDGEAKRTLISIGRNDLFYATAMKTLKSNFLGIQWQQFKTKISFRSPSDYKRKLCRFKSIPPSTTKICNNGVKLNWQYFCNKFDRKHNKGNCQTSEIPQIQILQTLQRCEFEQPIFKFDNIRNLAQK